MCDEIQHCLNSVVMPMSPLPPTGAYVLLIGVQGPVSICIGSLGNVDFRTGWYTYVGSAMGQTSTSLYHRLHRHFAPADRKQMHWHVDYLLASSQSKLAGTLIIPSVTKMECQVAALIQEIGGQPWGLRFGASDCRNCPSHLHFLDFFEKSQPTDQILARLCKAIQKTSIASPVLIKDKM